MLFIYLELYYSFVYFCICLFIFTYVIFGLPYQQTKKKKKQSLLWSQAHLSDLL